MNRLIHYCAAAGLLLGNYPASASDVVNRYLDQAYNYAALSTEPVDARANWFEEPELRYRGNDSEEHGIAFRFRPRFESERTAQNRIVELLNRQHSGQLKARLNDELKPRYLSLIELIEISSELEYLDASLELNRLRLQLNRSLVESEDFRIASLQSAEFEFHRTRQLAQRYRTRLQRQLRVIDVTSPRLLEEFLLDWPELVVDWDAIIEINHRLSQAFMDTRSCEFLNQRLYGKDGRFNIRARCYGDQGKAPYFLEIKRKRGFIGTKYRSVANEDEWPAIICDPAYRVATDSMQKDRQNRELFIRLAHSYATEPKLLTQYRRRAYASVVDYCARVTLDVSMKYRLQDHFSLASNGDMTSYDNQTIYARDMFTDSAVILELKCNVGEVPTWMLDLISTFNLKQQGFSKYLNSTLVAQLDDGIGYMSGDRMSQHFAYG